MIDEGTIPEPVIDGRDANPNFTLKESHPPKHILAQENISLISMLKADKSAVTPICQK